MMADSHRGWAWTRAFLGLQAKEIHVCGDSSVLEMLKSITKTCGDELVVHNYERWKELSVEGQSLGGSWKNVGEGDCVVAFSRKEIFQIKVGSTSSFGCSLLLKVLSLG
jgi:ATP-dependent RNA helicase SUPV3L1/SUV3